MDEKADLKILEEQPAQSQAAQNKARVKRRHWKAFALLAAYIVGRTLLKATLNTRRDEQELQADWAYSAFKHGHHVESLSKNEKLFL